MKLIRLTALALVCALLPNCTGLTAVVRTPYGDLTTSDGKTTVELKPITYSK